jgi:hypothetical protein
LAKWAFIFQEYDFDIVHKANRVNWNANGLSRNSSSNEEDPICAKWHGEVIWKQYQDGIPLHIYELCWDILGMYPKATRVVGIPTMTMMS